MHPVAAYEGRAGPVQKHGPRLRAGQRLRTLGDGVDPGLKAGAERCSAVADPGGVSDQADGLKDVAERKRLQIDERGLRVETAQDGADLGAGNRADIAQGLTDHQIRFERGQRLRIQGIDCVLTCELCAHGVVDLTRGLRLKQCAGQGRQGSDLRRPVTAMGDCDQIIGQPQSGDNLGRAGEQGSDAHATGSSGQAWDARRKARRQSSDGRSCWREHA